MQGSCAAREQGCRRKRETERPAGRWEGNSHRGGAGEDTEETAKRLAVRICNTRVFEDENGKMNLDLARVGGEILVVSQFTLYADLKSRRPGFSRAAAPTVAEQLYHTFMDQCRELGFRVQSGIFGADMQVFSVNDGPVTLIFDTDRT